MFTYILRRLTPSTDTGDGLNEDSTEFEAANDQRAIVLAQAQAVEPESGMFVIELRDVGDRIIWRLTRGDTISPLPGVA